MMLNATKQVVGEVLPVCIIYDSNLLWQGFLYPIVVLVSSPVATLASSFVIYGTCERRGEACIRRARRETKYIK